MHSSTQMRREAPAHSERRLLMGVSPVVRSLRTAIEEVAAKDVPVMITGERGAGKRTLAHEIHGCTGLEEAGFREINCAEACDARGLSPAVLSALNGNSAGVRTLYLSNFDRLNAAAQQQLHNVLCHRPGEHGRSARLICSTSANLDDLCLSGSFREDLHCLVTAICLRMPPLRHRKEDVPILLDEFFGYYAGMFSRSKPEVSREIAQFCSEHGFPGNVRELEEFARIIIAIGDQKIAAGVLRSMAQQSGKLNVHGNGHGNGYGNGYSHSNGNGYAPTYSLKDAGRAASLRAERELILQVLARTRWNRKRAAEELKISYKALLYKLKKIGADDETISSEEYLR